MDYFRPSSAAGSSFHPDLNLNLPPESIGTSGSVIIHANAGPLDNGFRETNSPCTNKESIKLGVKDVPSVLVEQPAQVVGSLLNANNNEISQPTCAAAAPLSPAFYPLIDLHAIPSEADASPPVGAANADGNSAEQTLLKELEEMGFKQIDLNKEILRLNEYDLEQSVDDLCGFAEWDPVLSELGEMVS